MRDPSDLGVEWHPGHLNLFNNKQRKTMNKKLTSGDRFRKFVSLVEDCIRSRRRKASVEFHEYPHPFKVAIAQINLARKEKVFLYLVTSKRMKDKARNIVLRHHADNKTILIADVTPVGRPDDVHDQEVAVKAADEIICRASEIPIRYKRPKYPKYNMINGVVPVEDLMNALGVSSRCPTATLIERVNKMPPLQYPTRARLYAVVDWQKPAFIIQKNDTFIVHDGLHMKENWLFKTHRAAEKALVRLQNDPISVGLGCFSEAQVASIIGVIGAKGDILLWKFTKKSEREYARYKREHKCA